MKLSSICTSLKLKHGAQFGHFNACFVDFSLQCCCLQVAICRAFSTPTTSPTSRAPDPPPRRSRPPNRAPARPSCPGLPTVVWWLVRYAATSLPAAAGRQLVAVQAWIIQLMFNYIIIHVAFPANSCAWNGMEVHMSLTICCRDYTENVLYNMS